MPDVHQGDLFEAAPLPELASACRLIEPLSAHYERLPPEWRGVLDPVWQGEVGQALRAFVDARLTQGAVIYPPRPFAVLEMLAPSAVKVVVIGQDPYHGPGQALGVAFGVAQGQKIPPSLRNIQEEVRADLGREMQSASDLLHWVRQGVLLLNTVLTVEEAQPQSHARRGWEAITDAIVAHLAARPQPMVFMLWGAAAQNKASQVGLPQHLVLRANHPSPLSARRGELPFLGCRHFSQTNAWLKRFHERVNANEIVGF
jgi:uracil-DNA glycosylase